MSKRLKIERIPYPGARIYSFVALKSLPLKDLYNEVAEEVTATMASGRVLDVGTGPGYLPLAIAKRAPRLDITGIDLSPAMVKIARTNAKRKVYSDRVRFVHANASDLPFKEGDFDLVVSTLSFHHWSKPLECLTEILRVLKADGEAWIYDARRDTTKEVNAQFRSRYGWFLAFIFLNLVRAHSSVMMREIEAILSSPELGFSKRKVVDKGVFLELKLVK
ncbi:MAG: class I SAM-dependent methyltransferase [Methanophagales archaeon ANME-1-THS]|nr:MAG: class I SAM-dependent methyltransferase [Methanophagales archaeon ANME-1-THS]